MNPIVRGRSAPALAAVLAWSVLGLIACGDGALHPFPPTIELEVDGRQERGLEVQIAVYANGNRLAGVTWSAEPASAVAFLDGGRARLLEAGEVTLRAGTDGSLGELRLVVALPPPILFEAAGAEGRRLHQASLDGRDLRTLAAGPGESTHATSAAGVVVFVNYRHGNADLFRLALSAETEAERLTASAADEFQPALSPDGARLAFARTVNGVPKLFIAGPDAAGAARAVPDGAGSAVEGSPSWSPAADRVAFMSTAGGRAGIYVLDVATGDVAPLLTGARTFVEPAWSPDGGRIAYAAADADGMPDIYLLELETGEERRLTADGAGNGQPAWLPDGRLVLTRWADGAPRLFWLDPAEPGEPYRIPLDVARPERAAAVR